MNFIDLLTPKDTEEIKPGLFVKKTKKGWKEVHPSAWKGKIIWKNLLFGPRFFRTLITFGVILFLVWSFNHDVGAYRNFYETVSSDPIAYCSNVSSINLRGEGLINENSYFIQGSNG